MSISSELITLNSTKQNIRSTINLKGVEVTDSDAFALYHEKVLEIPSGTGVHESQIKSYIERTSLRYIIPEGTTVIGDSAYFTQYINTPKEHLLIHPIDSELIVPEGVVYVGESAFSGLYNCRRVVLPDSLIEIGDSAFVSTGLNIGVSEVLEVSFGNSLQRVGKQAFAYNNRIKNLDFPNTLTFIGGFSFADVSLDYLVFRPTMPPEIGTEPSGGSNRSLGFSKINAIYVPDESVLAYQIDDNWKQYASYIKPLSEKTA